MGGNRKHGFMRGNAAGRNGVGNEKWFCHGCQKQHTGQTMRNKMSDGFDYCDKMYWRIKDADARGQD